MLQSVFFVKPDLAATQIDSQRAEIKFTWTDNKLDCETVQNMYFLNCYV